MRKAVMSHRTLRASGALMIRQRASRVRVRRRRGRSIVIWAGTLIVLSQLVTGLLLDHGWRHIRFPFLGQALERWSALPETPDIVFFGSSRFATGIRAAMVDAEMARFFTPAPRSFNASLPAADPILAERFLDELFAEGRRPKLVVLEVSPETVARRCDWLEQQALHFFTWSDCARYFPQLICYSHVTRVLSSRLGPLYRFRYELRKQARNAVLAGLGFGDGAKPPEPPSSPCHAAPERGATAASSHRGPPVAPEWQKGPVFDAGAIRYLRLWLRDYEISGIEPEALERLLGRLREQEIAVALVGVPVSKMHRDVYTPEIDSAFVQYMERLTRLHGCCFV